MGINVTKNLIYFIYFDGKVNDYHRLNLSLLSKYWNVFDGKKIVKIAVNNSHTNVKPILQLLPKDCNAIIVRNNKLMGESIHFHDSLKQVNGGYTFYAHCKGVTRPKMIGLMKWINALYDKNLSKEPVLNGKLFSGICAKLLPCPPFVPYDFHYSGSFYWFNTDKVKERLNDYNLNKYFTECFPAIVAKKHECQFNYHFSNKNINYYLDQTWLSIT